jgi:hypothetical protein
MLPAVVPDELPVVLPVVLPVEPSALLPPVELLRLPLLPAALEPDELLRPPLLPAALEPDEPLCRLLLPRLPEPCEPLCRLPALLVPPTEPLLLPVAGLAVLGEALALPRLPDEPLWLLPWPRLEPWFLPMLEPESSRFTSLPFPSVDF